jgi:putative ABC transport system ATP-binding protein
MDDDAQAQARGRRIGFVFQQFNLLASGTAGRNVELPLAYAGVPATERTRRAHAALDRVGLADKVHNRPGELSGGQQQRVAVARALVAEPDLILADEPTGNLDSTSTADILNLFDELHSGGTTIILITHEAEVADRAARVVHVRDGIVTEHSAAPGQDTATPSPTAPAPGGAPGTARTGTAPLSAAKQELAGARDALLPSPKLTTQQGEVA